MSISNNTNIPASIPGGIDSLNPSAADGKGLPSASGLSENFDWFSVGDGKALPISAQAQFGDTSNMDEMVSAMLGHLGLA